MPDIEIHSFECFKGESPALMARVLGNAGTAITQASLTAINLYVYRTSDLTTDLASGASLTIASVVYDTLQTADPRWTEDSTGYNFLYLLPTTYTGVACRLRVEIKFTPSSGAAFWDVWEGEVKGRAAA